MYRIEIEIMNYAEKLDITDILCYENLKMMILKNIIY